MSRYNDNVLIYSVLAMASGALLGAVTALLLAPAPGRETRNRLSDIQEGAGRKIKKYATEARYKMGGKGERNEDLQYDGGDAWI